MLPPLLQETDKESAAPSPQALRHLGIVYEPYGKSFKEMAKSIQFLQIVALPNPLYALFPFYMTSRDVYRAEFESWKWTIKCRIEGFFQGQMVEALEQLGAAPEMYHNIKGLAYRGTEVTGNDSEYFSSTAVKHFKSESLRTFHFISNVWREFRRDRGNLSLGMARLLLLPSPPMMLTTWPPVQIM
jgi:hypothetical protein